MKDTVQHQAQALRTFLVSEQLRAVFLAVALASVGQMSRGTVDGPLALGAQQMVIQRPLCLACDAKEPVALPFNASVDRKVSFLVQAGNDLHPFAGPDVIELGTSRSTSSRRDGSLGGKNEDQDSSAIPSVATADPEIEVFVQGVMADPDKPAHANNATFALEHAAVLALVPRSEATHIAVASGSWFDSAIWYQGRIPDSDAKALIPEGVTVTYDGLSDASLMTLRVDGALRFATDTDTRLIVDTMVISSSGQLEIGNSESPVQPDVRAEVLISNNGDIATDWDPKLLSRGVISHGKVRIHGAMKTAFLKVAEAPKRGDRAIKLAKVPEGWRVGDTIIVSGTRKEGWAWDNDAGKVLHHESQDEVVTITALDGDQVSFDRPLRYNHFTPRNDLFAYVANMTRNITFASQGGNATPVHQRGHVMFMHNDDVDVRYAAFNDLGRTDKSREASDVGVLPKVLANSNIKGRYPFHFHKTGTTDLQHPAIAIGNTVSGSPGWGFVHHSSNADFIDNVAFDVFGAAFAAEDGDETGIWLRNMAIRAVGFDWGDVPAKSGLERHDNGRTGDGFFFAGRLVEAAENVAVNTTHGFVWMHRSAPTGPLAVVLDHPEIAYGEPQMEADKPPIQGFRDNEAFGTEIGLMVIKANAEQGHDVRSVLDGFLNWETRKGVDISYTGHYTFLDFDLIGTYRDGFFKADTGFYFGTNAFDIVVNRLTVTDFPVGVNMNQDYTFQVPDSDVGYIMIDVKTNDVETDYVGFSPARHQILRSNDLVAKRLEVEQPDVTIGPNQDLILLAAKTDSIGKTPRQKAGDAQTVFRWEVSDLLRAVGYYTLPDGRKIARIPDLLADRATGSLVKLSYVVTLDMSDAELQGEGATSHGRFDPGNLTPTAESDSLQLTAGQEFEIDVLANDSDPERGKLAVEGFTDPGHGDVYLQPNGALLYRPNLGFVGTDSFTYWAGDDMGNYAPGEVKVEVLAP